MKQPIEYTNQDPLRNVDLMIAYLQDEVSVEKVEDIEALMESDPLYHLSMEQLAESLAETPAKAAANIRQTQEVFPDILTSAKEKFVSNLQTTATKPSLMDWLKGWSLWQKLSLLVAIALLVMVWLWVPGARKTLHQDPQQNLVIDQDVEMAQTLMNRCGTDEPGIGRQQPGRSGVSVFSALVENYSEAKFETAISQFQELEKRPGLSSECSSLFSFYLAKSYMARQDVNNAIQNFLQVVDNKAAPNKVKYASHWYAANIYLTQKNYKAAKVHLNSLLEGVDSNEHLKPLMEKKYLENAQQYLNELN